MNMSDIGKILGFNIQRYRNHLGYTQLDLAEALGVNRNAVAKWETGVNWPTKENINRLADLFDITSSKLFIDPADTSLHEDINDDVLKRIADIVIKKQARDKRLKKAKKK